jgi:hypothetical protein
MHSINRTKLAALAVAVTVAGIAPHFISQAEAKPTLCIRNCYRPGPPGGPSGQPVSPPGPATGTTTKLGPVVNRAGPVDGLGPVDGIKVAPLIH